MINIIVQCEVLHNNIDRLGAALQLLATCLYPEPDKPSQCPLPADPFEYYISI
jgi:hypothetical protein